MHPPSHRRDRQFGTLDRVPRALLFAAAMAIGCGFAAVVPAADDKARAIVDSPSKADADAPATTAVPTPEAAADVSAKTDSETTPGKRSPRRRGHIRIGDDDFDSFNAALHTAPWVVVWHFGRRLDSPDPRLPAYRHHLVQLRKTRLQNEAVLKLAERGARAPAQAVTR